MEDSGCNVVIPEIYDSLILLVTNLCWKFWLATCLLGFVRLCGFPPNRVFCNIKDLNSKHWEIQSQLSFWPTLIGLVRGNALSKTMKIVFLFWKFLYILDVFLLERKMVAKMRSIFSNISKWKWKHKTKTSDDLP